ncbi:MAG TPA: Sua5/YciO/YrdC/YwlC family protein [Solirubrobacteraceae bacterium]|jgi:L-threonylcarbamoyladenylate synthase|nr:Sua5/YciO/YrdC/YwlC family protein [Solirubrobacteraceae bacterium]
MTLAEVIASGGVAVIGTDTVYGVCVDALNEAAVERLLTLKGRPEGKPAAVAFESVAAALAALPELGEHVRSALAALLPGPLTLLVANPARRFPLAGGELLGVRVLDGLDAGGRPLLLSSANLAGGPEARRLEDLDPAILAGVDLALDAGELRGIPSTVVDLGGFEDDRSWRIVREGAVAARELQLALLGS